MGGPRGRSRQAPRTGRPKRQRRTGDGRFFGAKRARGARGTWAGKKPVGDGFAGLRPSQVTRSATPKRDYGTTESRTDDPAIGQPAILCGEVIVASVRSESSPLSRKRRPKSRSKMRERLRAECGTGRPPMSRPWTLHRCSRRPNSLTPRATSSIGPPQRIKACVLALAKPRRHVGSRKWNGAGISDDRQKAQFHRAGSHQADRGDARYTARVSDDL